jgi:hypothetical protein
MFSQRSQEGLRFYCNANCYHPTRVARAGTTLSLRPFARDKPSMLRNQFVRYKKQQQPSTCSQRIKVE